VPRTGAIPAGAPVETAPPNVPEFKPAFPGQTRAPSVKTRTPIVVTELAPGYLDTELNRDVANRPFVFPVAKGAALGRAGSSAE